MTTFAASAPTRLDLAGAWTDVAPFATDEGGAVTSVAIDLRAHASFTPGGTDFRLISDDLCIETAAPTPDALPSGGPLALLAAAVRRWRPPAGQLRTWCEAPAGAGLGGSGALGVAITAALADVAGRSLDRAGLATAAWEVETIDAGRYCGMQDQFAAAFGGIHRFGFSASGVTVRSLDAPAGFDRTLAHHLIVCFTGQSRLSSDAINRVMDSYRARRPPVVAALRELATLADAMAEAVVHGDLPLIGALLRANWKAQQRLDDGMQTPTMARLEAAMDRVGAFGGKAAGAGAGGSMFFLVPDRDAAIEAAGSAGATVLPLHLPANGVTAG